MQMMLAQEMKTLSTNDAGREKLLYMIRVSLDIMD